MSQTSKRDWFATGDDEDEDEPGYDSGLAEESKGKAFGLKGGKRRKLDSDDSASQDGGSDAYEEPSLEREANSIEREDVTEEAAPRFQGASKAAITGEERMKLRRKLEKKQAKVAKTGVVYLSRIPPFMKPHTLRHYLQPLAPSGLDRIFLTPEDTTTRSSRIKAGGNKKKTFLDGWVEFTSKREAKMAAQTLNGQNIGGKKGGYYYDDVWNLKYLKGFKWRHLTEQISNENAERAARLRAEELRERRERTEFLRNVEKGKLVAGMEKKRKQERTDPAEALLGERDGHSKREKMLFKQSQAVSKGEKRALEEPSADTRRVLSKIF